MDEMKRTEEEIRQRERMRAAAIVLSQELADSGQIVEGGWRAYAMLTGIDKMSEIQKSECRKAFYLGADHLYSTILTVLNVDDEEATAKDLERLEKLHAELSAFRETLNPKKSHPTDQSSS